MTTDKGALAKLMRDNPTPGELAMGKILHRTDYAWRSQVIQHGWILDFYCAELEVCVEVDGSRHSGQIAKARDRKRTAALASHGIRVLRFWNSEAINKPEYVFKKIQKFCT